MSSDHDRLQIHGLTHLEVESIKIVDAYTVGLISTSNASDKQSQFCRLGTCELQNVFFRNPIERFVFDVVATEFVGVPIMASDDL